MKYTCKVCGAEVKVDGQKKVWACEHAGGTVLAEMEAEVSSDGGVN